MAKKTRSSDLVIVSGEVRAQSAFGLRIARTDGTEFRMSVPDGAPVIPVGHQVSLVVRDVSVHPMVVKVVDHTAGTAAWTFGAGRQSVSGFLSGGITWLNRGPNAWRAFAPIFNYRYVAGMAVLTRLRRALRLPVAIGWAVTTLGLVVGLELLRMSAPWPAAGLVLVLFAATPGALAAAAIIERTDQAEFNAFIDHVEALLPS